MKDLVILGGGRNLLDTLDIIDNINSVEAQWRVIGLLDDGRQPGLSYCGYPVLGPLAYANAKEFSECLFVSTIWNERVCHQLHTVLHRTGLDYSRYATLVHPESAISSRAHLGAGVVINYGVSIGGEVNISDLVSIGPDCIIGHDSTIESFSAVAAGAILSGNVHVKRNSYIGSGSMIRQSIQVNQGAIIGLGAVVVNHVPCNTTVVGNPARPIARKLY